MAEIVFRVSGSAPEPYTVTFSLQRKNLTAHCTCPAGEVGQHCKHRLRILQGLKEAIVSGNDHEVEVVVSWLPGTDVEKALLAVKEAEAALEQATKEFRKAKKKLARVLMN